MRHGVDYILPNGEHTAANVLVEMFLQISRDYQALPDPRTLTADEIKFYYNGLRQELYESTKATE